jgi:hypothetical protein
MTDELKNLICNYIGIPYFESSFTGNDMIAAMNVMVERESWTKFFGFVCTEHYRQTILSMESPHLSADLFRWLMNPDNFFELMGKALEERVIGK